TDELQLDFFLIVISDLCSFHCGLALKCCDLEGIAPTANLLGWSGSSLLLIHDPKVGARLQIRTAHRSVAHCELDACQLRTGRCNCWTRPRAKDERCDGNVTQGKKFHKQPPGAVPAICRLSTLNHQLSTLLPSHVTDHLMYEQTLTEGCLNRLGEFMLTRT